MKATIVDLRYKMNDVLKALARNERVTVLYRGKVKGILIPPVPEKRPMKMVDHPFFGMSEDHEGSVDEALDALRVPRYNDI
jgi:hypothetical protein